MDKLRPTSAEMTRERTLDRPASPAPLTLTLMDSFLCDTWGIDPDLLRPLSTSTPRQAPEPPRPGAPKWVPKSFEAMVAEAKAQVIAPPPLLRGSPLGLRLDSHELVLLAAACRFAAQQSGNTSQAMTALADTILILNALPAAQRPANARHVEIVWVEGDAPFPMTPQMLLDERTADAHARQI